MPLQSKSADRNFNAECRNIHHRASNQFKMACVHQQQVNATSVRQANLRAQPKQPKKPTQHKIYDPKTLSPGLKVAQANGLQVYPKENMVQWGNKKIPTCDGWGFPYVEHCFNDMSNWSAPQASGQPKQCYLYNPGNSNLANGSIYTCGFLW